MNNNIIISDKQELVLLTMSEIAEKLGVSLSTISRRIAEMRIKPVVEGSNLGDALGATPAKFDFETFRDLQNEKQQMQIAKAHEDAVVREAARTKPEVKLKVMAEYIARLDADDSDEALKEVLANALGFATMLGKKAVRAGVRMEQMEKAHASILLEKDREIETLQKSVDKKKGWATLEKLNERFQWNLTRVELAGISRKLGQAGFAREHIVTVEHTRGVWLYELSPKLREWLNSKFQLSISDEI